MYPTDTPAPTEAPTTDPATTPAPAATEPAPATPEPVSPSAAPASSTPASSSHSGPKPGDMVRIRHDNGRGTLTETQAVVVRTVQTPQFHPDGSSADARTDYEVAPLATMRVTGDDLVDDEE